MKLKKNERFAYYQNRSFILCVVCNCEALATCHIAEYFPKRRFFKKKSLASYAFWVSDYKSITDGAETMLAKYLKVESDNLKTSRKWKEFYNGN